MKNNRRKTGPSLGQNDFRFRRGKAAAVHATLTRLQAEGFRQEVFRRQNLNNSPLFPFEQIRHPRPPPPPPTSLPGPRKNSPSNREREFHRRDLSPTVYNRRRHSWRAGARASGDGRGDGRGDVGVRAGVALNNDFRPSNSLVAQYFNINYY